MAQLASSPADVGGMRVPPAVEFRNVSKRFEMADGGSHTAVDGLSLSLLPGEFLCLLGPSGHGKSTLLNMLAGFTPPSDGYVLHQGIPVAGPSAQRGVVFQRDTLFPWKSVHENVTFGLRARGISRRERDEIGRHYLKLIELDRFADAHPHQLSGGMRRRVAIAAVLANRPDVLLMDEPFTGLDYVRRDRLYRILEDLWQEVRSTVFFITHDVDDALVLADRVVIIMRGKVVHDVRLAVPRPRTADWLAGPEASELRAGLMHELGKALRSA